MAKRCILVDTAIPVSELQGAITWQWQRCILCQTKTHERLQCPTNSRRTEKGAGYESLAKILPDFVAIGDLPAHLNALCKEPDLLVFLQSNEAVWHKSCRDKFSTRELLRKRGKATVSVLDE